MNLLRGIGIDMNISKTPRTDQADKHITYVDKISGRFPIEWVYAAFAQDLEIELNQLKKLLSEAEGHKEFMDNSEILKKMNTGESKEGVKRFFDNTKQNS